MIQLRELWHGVDSLKKIIQNRHSFIRMNHFRRKSRGVILARILEPSMTALLQRLSFSSKPRKSNHRTSRPFIPQSSNPLQQLFFLNLDIPMMKPFMIVLGRTRNSIRQRRRMIVYIKPLGPPVTNLTTRSTEYTSPPSQIEAQDWPHQ